MKNSRNRIVTGSFRDPSGFTFFREGVLYRQVNKCYQKNYDRLMDSGLYNTLIDKGSIISHEESTVSPPQPDLVADASLPAGMRSGWDHRSGRIRDRRVRCSDGSMPRFRIGCRYRGRSASST